MTLYFVYPAITVIMAWLVYGEVATWVSVAGCAVSLLGVAFIAQPPFIFGGSVQYDMSHWLGMHVPRIGLALSSSAAIASFVNRSVRSYQQTVFYFQDSLF